MKNAKQPITPCMYTRIGDGENDYLPLKDGVLSRTGYEVKFGGLTKLEYAAIMCLQGILSSRGLQEALNQDRQRWEDAAVEFANNLLNSLEKNEGGNNE